MVWGKNSIQGEIRQETEIVVWTSCIRVKAGL